MRNFPRDMRPHERLNYIFYKRRWDLLGVLSKDLFNQIWAEFDPVRTNISCSSQIHDETKAWVLATVSSKREKLVVTLK